MDFITDGEIVTRALDHFYQKSLSGARPVIHQPPLDGLVADLELASFVKNGELTGEKLAQFIAKYLAAITSVYHPANIAHQQAVPHYMAALAGLVDNFVSSEGSIYELGPASVSVEYFLINWLLEKVGWNPPALDPGAEKAGLIGGGILTHGGSIANLTALIAARTRIAPDVWEKGNPADLALLAPAEAHYSIARAIGIMGMGHHSMYPLPVDERGVIMPDRLQDTYQRAVSDGKQVLALVANAGSTAAGLYDPIQEIGAFCRERELWFHVDGAHGGSVLLSQKYRHLLAGIELADSLTVNAHKLMRVTAFCTALLVRDRDNLDRAFTQDASYLFHDKDQPGFDFIHRTIECTKPVLGLKLFMVLGSQGEAEIGEYIDRQHDLTLEAYEYLQSLDDFQCPVKPQSNILCFRVKGLDEGHLALRDKLLARGNFYISTTELNNQRYLRLTLTNPATTLDVIKGLVEEIRALVNEK